MCTLIKGLGWAGPALRWKKKKWGGKRVIFDFISANLLKHTWFCVFNRNNSRKYLIIVIDEWGMWCRRQIDAPPFPPGAGGCMTFSKIKKKQRGKGLEGGRGGTDCYYL